MDMMGDPTFYERQLEADAPTPGDDAVEADGGITGPTDHDGETESGEPLCACGLPQSECDARVEDAMVGDDFALMMDAIIEQSFEQNLAEAEAAEQQVLIESLIHTNHLLAATSHLLTNLVASRIAG